MSHRAALLAVAGLALSSVAPRAGEAEDKAVAKILKPEGAVKRDGGRKGKPVVLAQLSGPSVTDGVLKEVAACQEIEVLDLGGCVKVTDAGLEGLSGCKKLRQLSLAGCGQVTDGKKG